MYSGKWLGSYSGNWQGQLGEAPPGAMFGLAQFVFQATGLLTQYATSWLPIDHTYTNAAIDGAFDAVDLDGIFSTLTVNGTYSQFNIEYQFNQSNISQATGLYSISSGYATIDISPS